MVWHYQKPSTSSGSKQDIFVYLASAHVAKVKEFTSKEKIPIEQ
jgi:hypothetical protein